MEFEKETLDAVISARNQAVKIQANTLPTGGVQALAQAEATLTSAGFLQTCLRPILLWDSASHNSRRWRIQYERTGVLPESV